MPSAAKQDETRGRVKQILTKIARPTTEKDLIKQLRVKGEDRVGARKVIAEMLARGELARTRTDRIGLPEKMNLLPGRLICKAGGFGFVVPNQPGWKDVFVAGPDLGEALHGDEVLVHIERRGRDGRFEGRIVDVLERRTKQIVGRLVDDAGGTRVVPFDSRLLYEIFILSKERMGARAGEMVLIELTRYPAPYRAPLGRVVKVLGLEDDPGVDVRVILAKYGIRDEFPEAVVAESERIPPEVPPEVIGKRSDFRDRVIVTIDGETARDFDDAVEVEVLDNGHFLLGVHIADVSFYVREGSRLDEEAFERGTSVYFPDRAVPMLPERLSNGICSLKPGVDRLVQSVLIEVTPNGRIHRHEFHDAVIKSAARMTYTAVAKILLDRDEEVIRDYSSLVPRFESMRALYEILRARRIKRGSIDFDQPEAEVVLDDQGRVLDIRMAERNVAHRIIEEFMLLANEVVAGAFEDKEADSIYRVHEPPDEEKVEQFEDLILGLGHRLRSASEPVTPKTFQRLLKRIAGRPEERLISYVMLRTMKKAVYHSENDGHYALAASNYTHFTSPIRRYPDLIVHRLLRELRAGRPREISLDTVAQHSSYTERRADDAERELVDWKKVRFMADKVGEVFDGFVTGVTGHGLYVQLEAYFIEGLVRMSSLVDDYYRYNEEAHTLRGESTGKIFRLGDPVSVEVVRVDREQRQIDLAIEGMEPRWERRRERGASVSVKKPSGAGRRPRHR